MSAPPYPPHASPPYAPHPTPAATPIAAQAPAYRAPDPIPLVPPAAPYQPPLQHPPPPVALAQWQAQTLAPPHAEELRRARTRKTIGPKDEALFVREYIRTGRNEALAAKRIGIPPSAAPTFLRRRGTQELLRTWTETALSAEDVTQDRLLQLIGDAAFADRRAAYDPETGDLLPIDRLPENLAGIIDKVHKNGGYTLIPRSSGIQYVQSALGMNKQTTRHEGNVNVGLSALSLEELIQMSQAPKPETIEIEADWIEDE